MPRQPPIREVTGGLSFTWMMSIESMDGFFCDLRADCFTPISLSVLFLDISGAV